MKLIWYIAENRNHDKIHLLILTSVGGNRDFNGWCPYNVTVSFNIDIEPVIFYIQNISVA